LGNPDYVARIANGWPLAEPGPYNTWFTAPYEDPGMIYIYDNDNLYIILINYIDKYMI
jgi:hypothetical protein